MKSLVAEYDLDLDRPLVVKRAETSALEYSCEVNGFSVTLSLAPLSWTGRMARREKIMTRDRSHVVVSVSCAEVTEPPAVIPDLARRLDYTVQEAYFRPRTERYGRAAVEALNRLLHFFRYTLRQPVGPDLGYEHHVFQNPKWMDETGREVGKGPGVFSSQWLPAGLGVVPFARAHDGRLAAALKRPKPVALYEEILSSAQAAAFDGRIPSAVLGLAVACEVAVKRTFFGQRAPGASLLEYFEDSNQVRGRTVELLDKGATHVFGASFRTAFPKAYADIDHIFRCRNKVAHRGLAMFRDEKGRTITVDPALLRRWWKSVEVLSGWLRGVGRKWTQEAENRHKGKW